MLPENIEILTTMNISGSPVIQIVIVVSSPSIGLTFIVHLKIISKIEGRICMTITWRN